jgi:hypothetical protein
MELFLTRLPVGAVSLTLDVMESPDASTSLATFAKAWRDTEHEPARFGMINSPAMGTAAEQKIQFVLKRQRRSGNSTITDTYKIGGNQQPILEKGATVLYIRQQINLTHRAKGRGVKPWTSQCHMYTWVIYAQNARVTSMPLATITFHHHNYQLGSHLGFAAGEIWKTVDNRIEAAKADELTLVPRWPKNGDPFKYNLYAGRNVVSSYYGRRASSEDPHPPIVAIRPHSSFDTARAIYPAHLGRQEALPELQHLMHTRSLRSLTEWAEEARPKYLRAVADKDTNTQRSIIGGAMSKVYSMLGFEGMFGTMEKIGENVAAYLGFNNVDFTKGLNHNGLYKLLQSTENMLAKGAENNYEAMKNRALQQVDKGVYGCGGAFTVGTSLQIQPWNWTLCPSDGYTPKNIGFRVTIPLARAGVSAFTNDPVKPSLFSYIGKNSRYGMGLTLIVGWKEWKKVLKWDLPDGAAFDIELSFSLTVGPDGTRVDQVTVQPVFDVANNGFVSIMLTTIMEYIGVSEIVATPDALNQRAQEILADFVNLDAIYEPRDRSISGVFSLAALFGDDAASSDSFRAALEDLDIASASAPQGTAEATFAGANTCFGANGDTVGSTVWVDEFHRLMNEWRPLENRIPQIVEFVTDTVADSPLAVNDHYYYRMDINYWKDLFAWARAVNKTKTFKSWNTFEAAFKIVIPNKTVNAGGNPDAPFVPGFQPGIPVCMLAFLDIIAKGYTWNYKEYACPDPAGTKAKHSGYIRVSLVPESVIPFGFKSSLGNLSFLGFV